MKLYFYEFRDNTYYEYPGSVTVKEIEVVEKPKTFYPANGKFPQYMSFIKKEDVGGLVGYNNDLVVLAEPNFEKAKGIFYEYLWKRVNKAKKEFSKAEENLKTLMDCEVAIDV